MKNKNLLIIGIVVLIIIVLAFVFMRSANDAGTTQDNSAGTDGGGTQVEGGLETDEEVFNEIDSAVDAIG